MAPRRLFLPRRLKAGLAWDARRVRTQLDDRGVAHEAKDEAYDRPSQEYVGDQANSPRQDCDASLATGGAHRHRRGSRGDSVATSIAVGVKFRTPRGAANRCCRERRRRTTRHEEREPKEGECETATHRIVGGGGEGDDGGGGGGGGSMQAGSAERCTQARKLTSFIFKRNGNGWDSDAMAR